MKLEVGQQIPDFSYNLVGKSSDSFVNDLKENKTVMVFLRYVGCTVCMYYFQTLQDNLERFKEQNTDLYVFVQSSEENIKKAIDEFSIEYNLVSDPSSKIYKLFDIQSAENMDGLLGSNTMEIIEEVKSRGLEHGEYEGDELQLPAVFVVDKDACITKLKYATHVTDLMTIDEMLSI